MAGRMPTRAVDGHARFTLNRLRRLLPGILPLALALRATCPAEILIAVVGLVVGDHEPRSAQTSVVKNPTAVNPSGVLNDVHPAHRDDSSSAESRGGGEASAIRSRRVVREYCVGERARAG